MLIKCPYCGERPSEEFTYRGDARPNRPDSLEESAMEEWFDYVYLRDNVKGKMHEHWHHSGGCRAWLVVERDTQSHEVFGVTTAQDYARKGKI